MEGKKSVRVLVMAVIAATVLVTLMCVTYMVKLNDAVHDNVVNNISELAAHDKKEINNYIESSWRNLEKIRNRFRYYDCNTVEQVQQMLNMERINSDFTHIYLLGKDGKIYTDKFVTYNTGISIMGGRIQLLPYFENGNDRLVTRFDDRLTTAGMVKESILYGISLKDFSAGGVEMIALIGLCDISSIQDKLSIESFVEDGVSNGHSAVITQDGNYIVNIKRKNYLNENENFFRSIDRAERTELERSEIVEKMEGGESFTFSFVDENGKEELVYCLPFKNSAIPWYFMMSVDKAVFTKQNKEFSTLTLATMAGIIIVVISMMIIVVRSHNKRISEEADISARRDILAKMSHEIRTPLNGILGLIHLMKKNIYDEQKWDIIKSQVEKEEETANYLLSLVNNILDFSKMQAGKMEIDKKTVSVDIIADAIWSMQKNNMEDRGIRFVVEKDILFPWIISDDVLIKRVLMNIVGNAAKYTARGGKITLLVMQELEDAKHVKTTFICEDNGCGMTKDFLAHIWEGFSQERNNGVNNTEKGTGLGMLISKLIVEAMGGEISVESKVNLGSTFTVDLHSEISAEEKVSISKRRRIDDEDSGPMIEFPSDRPLRILVAEDNELNAEILIEILEDEGFETVHAENGRAAVEKFDKSGLGEISFILMDMQMPVMDGCTATKEIRKLERADAKNVIIFACTANTFQEDRIQAIESGMDDFLAKPIDINILKKKLQSYIEGQVKS